MIEPSVETVDRYTKGDCHLLAYAIHVIAGWPMRATMADIYDHVDQTKYYVDWTHAFVELPDGRMLDIEGIHTWEKMIEGPFGDPEMFDYQFGEYVDDVYIGPFPSSDVPSNDDLDEETIRWAEWAVEHATSQKLLGV